MLDGDGGRRGVPFAHALIREALYEGTPADAAATAWHRGGRRALLADRPDARPGRGRLPLPAGGRRAGDRVAHPAGRTGASAAYAWLTAAERYEAALAILRAGRQRSGLRCVLLVHMAWLRRWSHPAESLAALDTAWHLADRIGEPVLAAASRLVRGIQRCRMGILVDGLVDIEVAAVAIDGMPADDGTARTLPAQRHAVRSREACGGRSSCASAAAAGRSGRSPSACRWWRDRRRPRRSPMSISASHTRRRCAARWPRRAGRSPRRASAIARRRTRRGRPRPRCTSWNARCCRMPRTRSRSAAHSPIRRTRRGCRRAARSRRMCRSASRISHCSSSRAGGMRRGNSGWHCARRADIRADAISRIGRSGRSLSIAGSGPWRGRRSRKRCRTALRRHRGRRASSTRRSCSGWRLPSHSTRATRHRTGMARGPRPLAGMERRDTRAVGRTGALGALLSRHRRCGTGI